MTSETSKDAINMRIHTVYVSGRSDLTIYIAKEKKKIWLVS